MPSPQPRPVQITTEYIELDKLLKREDCASSGGAARHLIDQGLVRVNGAVETRRRKKLRPGDTVSCMDALMVVRAALPRKED
ncbi:MAG: RNA-binding S4 domain-containing protein [Desulfobulbus sp.]|jgi:ribosome-associated protein